MKTLKDETGRKFVRLPNKTEAELREIKVLLDAGWKFCPKHEFRKEIRRVWDKKMEQVKAAGGLEKYQKKMYKDGKQKTRT